MNLSEISNSSQSQNSEINRKAFSQNNNMKKLKGEFQLDEDIKNIIKQS